MAGTTDMNIIIGQGNAIKEVHNVRKQSLELGQQFTAQEAEEKKKEDKTKVQELPTENRIEIKGDEEKKKRQEQEDSQKGPKKEQSQEEPNVAEGILIDIKV
jgi:hypothetical protein